MRTRLSALTLVTVGAAICAPACAQTMKPGLWEINNTMGGQADPRMQEMLKAQKQQMAEMRSKLAEMPPAQRKQIEDMMNKMGTGGGLMESGGMTMKMCVTPEMAAQNQLLEQRQGNCTNKRSPAVGGVMKFSYSCTNPQSSGEGTATFSGDSAYSMNMAMNTLQNGKNVTTTMATKGKWLAASCGDVKPPVLPPAMK